jgi:hypothetical protein
LQALKDRIRRHEENEEKQKELERSLLRITVHYFKPDTGALVNFKLKIHREMSVAELKEECYQVRPVVSVRHVTGFVPLS